MISSGSLIKYTRPLLLLTFILPFYQGTHYVLIGWIYPLVIISIIISPVIFFTFFRQVSSTKILRYWGYLHLGYGVVGFTLIGISALAGSGVPSAVFYQLDIWYILKMAVCLILGALLLKMRKAHHS